MAPDTASLLVKALAAQAGFNSCRIAKAVFLEDEAPRLEQWLTQGRHGSMGWMENYFDKRLDPRKLMPGAKSVITLSVNYYSNISQADETYKVSRYALGRDYHRVIKKMGAHFIAALQEDVGACEARIFVDSAPVMDKAWAARSGQGWIGKNSNLLSKQAGSYFFLAEVICDLELATDPPVTDHCGTCTRCIDACPTQAITPYEVDGSKCISYYTIELKEQLPKEANLDGWIFGCDICQEVCPWNRFAQTASQPDLLPRAPIIKKSKDEWEALTQEAYEKLAEGSPLRRAGYKKVKEAISHNKSMYRERSDALKPPSLH